MSGLIAGTLERLQRRGGLGRIGDNGLLTLSHNVFALSQNVLTQRQNRSELRTPRHAHPAIDAAKACTVGCAKSAPMLTLRPSCSSTAAITSRAANE